MNKCQCCKTNEPDYANGLCEPCDQKNYFASNPERIEEQDLGFFVGA